MMKKKKDLCIETRREIAKADLSRSNSLAVMSWTALLAFVGWTMALVSGVKEPHAWLNSLFGIEISIVVMLLAFSLLIKRRAIKELEELNSGNAHDGMRNRPLPDPVRAMTPLGDAL